jgi:SAM-dependent methyltransferase
MSDFWERQAKIIDRARFRGSEQYLEQRPEFPYEALYADLVGRGLGSMFEVLKEDGAFGCETKWLDGPELVASRDLIESIYEIAFIKECLGSLPKQILDIGAGYGRLAHRILALLDDVDVYCVDTVPISRKVCEQYLSYRGVNGWSILEPENITEVVGRKVDLAVNIHSWPECSREEIDWWLERLKRWGVPYLMVIPHNPTFRCHIGSDPSRYGDGEFRSLIEARGYVLTTERFMPKAWPRTYTMWKLDWKKADGP